MERLTDKYWRNLDPWECCGQDNYCQRGCHDEGGCANGCKVPKIYSRLARYEDLGVTPEDVEELLSRAIKHKDSFNAKLTKLLYKFDQLIKKYEKNQHVIDLLTAETEGRLVKLPCLPNDFVYTLETECTFGQDCGTKMKCKGCEYHEINVEKHLFNMSMIDNKGNLNPDYFLDFYEAAKSAEEMK